MPLSSLAFTIGALGMIGMPPVVGFISKWMLGVGAVQAERPWVIAVLVASTLLNAAYFLPILNRLWFRPGPVQGIGAWPTARAPSRLETSAWLLLPALATALLSLLAGMLAGLPFSPLQWATRVVDQTYLAL
jgi:multicomponent Na+:H+ antiporter subunit D